MFLPVLLVRDYGIWGFIAFAVPNVIGAAAMGWVLTGTSSHDVVQRHARACAWFSLVTIAFQVFFFVSMTGLLRELTGEGGRWKSLLLFGLLAAVLATATEARRATAAVVWIASAILLGLGWKSLGTPLPPTDGLFPTGQLAFLAPVCVLGFLLCPYLDLSFHRARQQCPGPRGRWAFGLGFGVLFLAMILGTLTYFQPALDWLNDQKLAAPRLALWAFTVHVMIQLVITVAFHGDEFVKQAPADRARRTWGPVVVVLAVIASALLVRFDVFHGLISTREVVYRLFMSFYGLVFPAYVWLCMIPAGGEIGTQRPTTRKVAVLLIACLLAAPFYWMGFIERQAIWLAPGLGIVLVSRAFIRRR